MRSGFQGLDMFGLVDTKDFLVKEAYSYSSAVNID